MMRVCLLNIVVVLVSLYDGVDDLASNIDAMKKWSNWCGHVHLIDGLNVIVSAAEA